MARYWLGLLTDTGEEPPASAGYARVALDLPDAGVWVSTRPIIFCKARFAWPILTQGALFDEASYGTAFMATTLAPPGDTIAPLPLAVDETEEAVVPASWLYFRFVTGHTPRPYGRYRYGRRAYGSWPVDAVVQFRMGARLLADKIPVACIAWAPASTWLGRNCA